MGNTTTIIFLWTMTILVLSTVWLVLMYALLASPPMHWVYSPAPPAGPSSVYVPGSGFSGFWFHLGALQSIPNLHDYEFYCYSSGCLSVVMAAMNCSLDNAVDIAGGIQQSWFDGDISRFEIVDRFLDHVLGDYEHQNNNNNNTAATFLHSNLNVLVTSKGNGLEIAQATNRQELKDILKKTTWIPFVTGDGVMRRKEEPTLLESSSNNNWTRLAAEITPPSIPNDDMDDDDEFYLDGGFSRTLHPPCQHDLRVPNTWVNLLYTLHPGMQRHQIDEMFQAGQQFDHPLLQSSMTATTWLQSQ